MTGDPASIAHHRKTLSEPKPPRGPRPVTLPDDKARRIRKWLEWLLSQIQPLGPWVPPLFETVTQLQELIALLPAPQDPNDP